jgi:hypothetical protein
MKTQILTDEFQRQYVVRYVLTFVDDEGNRRMISPMQGRNTFETASTAQERLDAILNPKTNSKHVLEQCYGDVSKVAVRPCKCYPGHFDPLQYYFDFAPTEGKAEK